ncbi:MAG: hypothetical protein A4E66_02537 [Syntrophus sp. PtaB.Bin001]|nr:MAG: hypothetical protein A4E66_02537 [Syntrophus sp. PtaB.Bin001]
MPQGNCSRRTHGVAKAIALAQNRIHGRLFALLGLDQFDGSVCTDRRTGAAAHTLLFVHFADGTRGGDCIAGQESQYPTGCSVSLVDRFRDMLGILGQPAKEDTVGGKLDGPQFDVGFLEETVQTQHDLELRGDILR